MGEHGAVASLLPGPSYSTSATTAAATGTASAPRSADADEPGAGIGGVGYALDVAGAFELVDEELSRPLGDLGLFGEVGQPRTARPDALEDVGLSGGDVVVADGGQDLGDASFHRAVRDFDILVHGQDIAIPLQRHRDMPVEAARVGAACIWAIGWLFWTKRKLRGYRITATGVDWAAGSGADVR